MTACSDPGIVFVQRHFSQHTGSDEDRDSSGVMLTNRQETASDKAGHCESNEEFRASDDDPNIESDLESAVPLETSTILGRSHSPSNSNAAATSSSLAPGTLATNRISVGHSSLANRNSHNNVAGFALLGAPSSTAASMLPQPMVECGRCQIDRPTIAYHCGYCGVCVRKLDHHCPVSIFEIFTDKGNYAFNCYSFLCLYAIQVDWQMYWRENYKYVLWISMVANDSYWFRCYICDCCYGKRIRHFLIFAKKYINWKTTVDAFSILWFFLSCFIVNLCE